MNTASPAQYDAVIEVLETVEDPELGINLFDLGLLDDVKVNEAGRLILSLVPTSPGCPYTATIDSEVSKKLHELGHPATVSWLLTRGWHVGRMTDEGKAQLSALGISAPPYYERS